MKNFTLIFLPLAFCVMLSACTTAPASAKKRVTPEENAKLNYQDCAKDADCVFLSFTCDGEKENILVSRKYANDMRADFISFYGLDQLWCPSQYSAAVEKGVTVRPVCRENKCTRRAEMK